MKLFKYLCGVDERISVFADETEAYERRTEVDPTFHFLPVQIDEITVPGYKIISEADDASSIKNIRDLLDVQGQDGNWNYDPYMLGMYNGLECASAVLENREPVYRVAPEKWLSAQTLQGEPEAGEIDTPNDVPTPTIDPNVPLDDEFEGMDKPALKAWLDENGVEYTPQWGDKRLRETARAWVAAQNKEGNANE
ncbi:hypothetical protein AB6A23_11150 [Paenibacillus tarimensis]